MLLNIINCHTYSINMFSEVPCSCFCLISLHNAKMYISVCLANLCLDVPELLKGFFGYSVLNL